MLIERRLRSTSFVGRDKQTRERGLHKSGWSSVAGIALRWNCYRHFPRTRYVRPSLFRAAPGVSSRLSLDLQPPHTSPNISTWSLSRWPSSIHLISPGAPEIHVTTSTQYCQRNTAINVASTKVKNPLLRQDCSIPFNLKFARARRLPAKSMQVLHVVACLLLFQIVAVFFRIFPTVLLYSELVAGRAPSRFCAQ